MVKTSQELFWSGEFGDNYTDRNRGGVISNIALFSNILRRIENVDKICEFGSNIGLNLVALHSLLPQVELTGIEINQKAARELAKLDYVKVCNSSIYEADILTSEQYDLTFTKGVLIHQNPDMLSEAYRLLYQASRRYILVCEYYNPTPVEVEYRGNKSVLFKRDFAGELMDKYPSLYLVDYGFVYHRDNHFPGDDLTWFLMEKR